MKSPRHPLEMPIVVLSVVACVVTLIATWLLLALVILALFTIDPSRDVGLTLEDFQQVSEMSITLAFVPFIPVGLLLARLGHNRGLSLNTTESTADQVSDLHMIASEYARRAGLKHPPRIFIITGDHPLDDAHGFGHAEILIHNDLTEICRANGDPSPLRFAIARQVGRIAAGHFGRARYMLSCLIATVPVWSGLYARAEQYTADMWGLKLAPDAAADYLGLVGASKVRWPEVDPHELADQSYKDVMLDALPLMNMHNPPLAWRAHAMEQTGVFDSWRPLQFPPNFREATLEGPRPIPLPLPEAFEVNLKAARGHIVFPPRRRSRANHTAARRGEAAEA